MAPFAGIDLGASKIMAVVGQVEGVRGRARRPTPAGPAGSDVTEAVLATLRDASADAGIDPMAISSLGIGSFGPLDLADGAVVDPANLPASVDRVPLTDPCAALIDGDVSLHNDTTAGLIGERFVASEHPDDMVYLTISTGIGAGVAVDGHVLSGWDGNVGELGHLTVDPAGTLPCGCGREGHWEAYASGRGMPRYARHLAGRHDAVVSDLPLDDPSFSAADIFDAAGTDPLANLVLKRVGAWNAIGLANLVHAFAPLVVSVGGSVARHNPAAVLDPMRDAIEDLVITNVPEIRSTSLGADAVVIGALASAMTEGTGDPSRDANP